MSDGVTVLLYASNASMSITLLVPRTPFAAVSPASSGLITTLSAAGGRAAGPESMRPATVLDGREMDVMDVRSVSCL